MCGGNVFVLLRFVFPERVTDPFILQAGSLWFTQIKVDDIRIGLGNTYCEHNTSNVAARI